MTYQDLLYFHFGTFAFSYDDEDDSWDDSDTYEDDEEDEDDGDDW